MSDGPRLEFDPIAEARRQWDAHELGAVDQMAAATSITRAHQIVVGAINTALKPLGLTFARFEALRLLAFSRRGELPLGKMGDRLMVHPTSITNVIDRLETDGLVARIPHPTDRRTTLARLTDDGARLVEKATAALVDLQFGLDGMGTADLRHLEQALTSLRATAGDFELAQRGPRADHAR